MTATDKTATVAVIGTGTMGRGIAQWAVSFGHTVLLYDTRQGAADEAVSFIRDRLDRSRDKGKLSPEQHAAMLKRLVPVSQFAELAPADIAIEAIVERVDAKQQLFADLEAVLADDAVLATNTSSLSVTEIAARCARPDRVGGLHFFNPVPLMKVAEVIPGERTSARTTKRLLDFVGTTTHRAVTATDTPGFLVNHAGRGLNTEGLRIVQEGVGTHRDVDRVMTDMHGFPMGPFALFDLTGLDVSGKVLEYIYDGFFQEPRFRPSPWPRRRMAAGMFGRKAGGGFYDYAEGKRVEEAEPEPMSLPRPLTVRLGEGDETFVARIADLLRTAGVSVAAGEGSGADAVTILFPLGLDATEAALAASADPKRTLCIDPFVPASAPLPHRLTLMPSPATDTSLANLVADALRLGGAKVTRIHDSTGFIGQRMIAMIVNIACDICQQRVASPEDVDQAVKLGLGYPSGPLMMGDNYGAPRILTILTEIERLTGDPRYRPSPWLRRRARLGLSLRSADV